MNKPIGFSNGDAELQHLVDELQSENDQLKQLISDQTPFAEKRGWIKHTLPCGVVVYKDESPGPSQTPQPSEWFCKHCADVESQESTIQPVHKSTAGTKYRCHSCSFEFDDLHAIPVSRRK